MGRARTTAGPFTTSPLATIPEFYAVRGYDLCTGWGTPSGQALINAITGVPGSPGVPPGTGTPIFDSLTTNVWQLALTRIAPGLKDVGTAFITFSNDGSFTGYGLSTHSDGMFTYSGTWALGKSGTITGAFNESPQSISGSVTGKATTKALVLSLTTSNSIAKLNGKPVTASIPDFSGSWNITLKAFHTNIVDSVSITTATGYPGVFEIAGDAGDLYGLSGAAIETTKGALTMDISSSSLGDTAALTGKFNPTSQTANVSGKDENNHGVKAKLTRP